MTLEQFRIADVCIWKGRIASNRAAELLHLPRVAESDLLAGRYEGVLHLYFGFDCWCLVDVPSSLSD